MKDDVDIAVSFQRGKACMINANDRILYLFAQPAGHELLRARSAEIDGNSILEEYQGRETLNLELSLQFFVGVEVDLCQPDYITVTVPSGRVVRRSAANSIQIGASFLQCPHQGV